MSRNPYTERLPPSPAVGALLLQTAIRVALRYTHRLPTVDELQAEFGMHRATAYRWVAAMRAVRDGETSDTAINNKRQGIEDDKRA